MGSGRTCGQWHQGYGGHDNDVNDDNGDEARISGAKLYCLYLIEFSSVTYKNIIEKYADK